MKEHMPEAYSELTENCKILELHYKDMMVRSMLQSSLNCFKDPSEVVIVFPTVAGH